jgi:DNA-directed RNA polymerase subunit beta'
LLGLKENVIIGKLIPAGTGMKRYKNIDVDYGVNTEFMENYSQMLYEQEQAEAEEDELGLAESDQEILVSDEGIEIVQEKTEEDDRKEDFLSETSEDE